MLGARLASCGLLAGRGERSEHLQGTSLPSGESGYCTDRRGQAAPVELGRLRGFPLRLFSTLT